MAAAPGVELVIAGEGPDRGPLEQRARALGIADRVRFLGAQPRERIVELFRAADATILSSSWENFPHMAVEDAIAFMLPSSSWQLLFVNDQPSSVELPSSVVLEVSDTEPGIKGDTVSNVTKPATLETGAVVQVPLFVNVGDKIKVDPREKRYISRA